MTAEPADALGVLLFYHISPLMRVGEEMEWHTHVCAALQLTGRLRVAPAGLNGTLSGSISCLRRYAADVECRYGLEHVPVEIGRMGAPAGVTAGKGARSCIDWKLDAINDASQLFDTLRVRAVTELVSLGVGADVAPLQDAGMHISPQDFHRLCLDWRLDTKEAASSGGTLCTSHGLINEQRLNAQQRVLCSETSRCNHAAVAVSPSHCLDKRSEAAVEPISRGQQPPVLLDVRNEYEWRLGRFELPAHMGVTTLLPNIRQFSELPAWLSAHVDKLRGRDVLMYCTGGVRCEAASALVRKMLREACDEEAPGAPGSMSEQSSAYDEAHPNRTQMQKDDASNAPGGGRIFQLHGGIVRYLEAFGADPDRCGDIDQKEQRARVSCLFRGKNLVFDARHVGGGGGGNEHECTPSSANEAPHHSESASRPRESTMPMTTRTSGTVGMSPDGLPLPPMGVCLSCGGPAEDYRAGVRCCYCRVRLLVCGGECASRSHVCTRCAHRDMAENATSHSNSTPEGPVLTGRPLRILCLHGFRQTGDGLRGRLQQFIRKMGPSVQLHFIDAPHALEAAAAVSDVSSDASSMCAKNDRGGHAFSNSKDHANRKQRFTWLHGPICLGKDTPHACQVSRQIEGDMDGTDTSSAQAEDNAKRHEPTGSRAQDRKFCPWPEQTEGWAQTLNRIRCAVASDGPFDGLLGFSQGAAVAAALMAVIEAERSGDAASRAQASSNRMSHQGTQVEPDVITSSPSDTWPPLAFRFVILCSGFQAAAPEHRELFARHAPINCPSLHIIGYSDRQMTHQTLTTPACRTSASFMPMDPIATSAIRGQAQGVHEAATSRTATAKREWLGADASEALVRLFRSSCGRVVVRHQSGHVLPCADSHIRQYRHFLQRFIDS